jgi:thermolysin
MVLVLLAVLVGPGAQAQVRIAAVTPADVAYWDARVEAMLKEGTLRGRQTRDDALVAGRRHERLAQYFQGVPVEGGEIVRQMSVLGPVSIFGTLYEGIALDPSPTLSAAQAKAIVEGLAGAQLGASRRPELVILPRPEGGFALTWRLKAFGKGDLRLYYVDARTGALVHSRSELKTDAAVGIGTGVLGDRKKVSASSETGTFTARDLLRPPSLRTFDMKGNIFRTIDFLNGFIDVDDSDLARDSDNTWSDGANVDGHVYAGYVYDYYFKRHGRRGLDNRDIGIRSLVHPVSRDDYFSYPFFIINIFYLNAFYAGDGVMVYGEGLPPGLTDGGGRSWDFVSGALDIVAHELTHGVTEFSSNLIYENEPGALNEAFSDIMATSVEFYFQPAGSGKLQADYLLGEDVITPGGIRSMADPAAYGDPDNYSTRYLGPLDNGGVHINSGIPNHAFFLAIEGGTNRTSGITVTGVGGGNREQIEKAFYRAFTQMLPQTANFATARAATIQAARDLYGAGSPPERSTAQAWTAVGVN